MVDFNYDTENQRCECKSEKNISTLYIEKERGGYRFFVIRQETGLVPKELSGKYSSILKAQEAVTKYFRNKKPTDAARRKEFGDNYEKRKKAKDGAKTKPKGSKHVHQGLSD